MYMVRGLLSKVGQLITKTPKKVPSQQFIPDPAPYSTLALSQEDRTYKD